VLKVSWHLPTVAHEVSALRAWNGHGAVQLVAADEERGALLLERLDPARTLRHLELHTAAAVAGSLIRQLAVPAPAGIPAAASYGRQVADGLRQRNRSLGGPVPNDWVDRAAALAGQLASDAGSTLVHADLHYGNVLAGTREPWLAIDPRAVAGDPEQSVPELMWTRIDELDDEAIPTLLDVIVDAGRLNAEKARAWTVVRAVDYWLWGLPIGLTIDPARCARLLSSLGPVRRF
jgi:streptomycin 6-kinase